MPIRTRMTQDGYQQVELTSELLHGSSGPTQQVISTVPCTKHLPFFLAIFCADILLFGSVASFAVYAAQYGGGLSHERSSEAPMRQFNLHALVMLAAFVYLNGQAIMAYKANYLVKHKSVSMLHHFCLHALAVAAILAGLYLTYEAQETVQSGRPRVAHLYSVHSWTGLVTIGLFAVQFLFGFSALLLTICCRKLTTRLRTRLLPVHRMIAMLVLCASTVASISGLTQLARFELAGQEGRQDYRDFGASTWLVNASGMCVLAGATLVVLVTFAFKRRQAHDLPATFKIVLLVSQFVELVLLIVIGEFILQLVTPHVNKVLSGELLSANSSLTHVFNNATSSLNSLINKATQHISNTFSGGAATTTNVTAPDHNTSSIILGPSNVTASNT